MVNTLELAKMFRRKGCSQEISPLKYWRRVPRLLLSAVEICLAEKGIVRSWEYRPDEEYPFLMPQFWLLYCGTDLDNETWKKILVQSEGVYLRLASPNPGEPNFPISADFSLEQMSAMAKSLNSYSYVQENDTFEFPSDEEFLETLPFGDMVIDLQKNIVRDGAD